MQERLKQFFQEIAMGTEASVVEEIEYVFFLKLEDFDQLSKAESRESQEQWSLHFPGESVEQVVRVRRSVKDEGEPSYVLASKTNFADLDGKWELEKEVDAHHFDHPKKHAKEGLRKDRLFFPVPDSPLLWEVDVFYDSDNNPVEWVKLDLEVTDRLDSLPEFPLKYEEVLLEQHEQRNEDQKAFVRDLFENHYHIRG